MNRVIAMFLTGAIGCHALLAQTTKSVAPGAPGHDAHWPTAAKDRFGTSNTTASKVWFTLSKLNGDNSSAAAYLRTADEWADSVEGWTATTNGLYGDGHYYLRLTEKGNADQATKIEINSGGGTYDQREIVDAGFLELVRLGIKAADDPLILKSIMVVDNLLKIETPPGLAWYRYNHDAYGERLDGQAYDARTGRGRLWTLLTGERGEFELARANVVEARRLLETLGRFANDGFMIPEQVWDNSGPLDVKIGSGTGSATPLAWSMAQFIRLAINLQENRNVETPDVVAGRY